jgi:hypothetical protein
LVEEFRFAGLEGEMYDDEEIEMSSQGRMNIVNTQGIKRLAVSVGSDKAYDEAAVLNSSLGSNNY